MTQAIWVILGVLAVPVVLLLATTGCGLEASGAWPPPEDGDVKPPPPPPTYEETVLDTAGLEGYWRLGEPNGETAVNSLQPGILDGVYVYPGITLGQTGAVPNDTAALFEGGYVDVPPPQAEGMPKPLAAGPEVTVELWARLPTAVPDWGLLVGCYEPTVSPDDTIAKGYRLRVRTVDEQIEIEANLGGMPSPLTTQIPIDDDWHHVVLTYAPAPEFGPGAEKAELYIDGGLPTELAVGIFDVVTTQSLRFGGGYPFFEPVTYPYLGLLDEVALYQTYLSQGDVDMHIDARFNAATP
jgi:hypothetical protein